MGERETETDLTVTTAEDHGESPGGIAEDHGESPGGAALVFPRAPAATEGRRVSIYVDGRRGVRGICRKARDLGGEGRLFSDLSGGEVAQGCEGEAAAKGSGGVASFSLEGTLEASLARLVNFRRFIFVDFFYTIFFGSTGGLSPGPRGCIDY